MKEENVRCWTEWDSGIYVEDIYAWSDLLSTEEIKNLKKPVTSLGN